MTTLVPGRYRYNPDHGWTCHRQLHDGKFDVAEMNYWNGRGHIATLGWRVMVGSIR